MRRLDIVLVAGHDRLQLYLRRIMCTGDER